MDASVWQATQLSDLRELIDETLDDLLPQPATPSRLQRAMRHAALGPGKRIRPLLALVTAAQLGCPRSRALPGACAIELVHAASLVLDDLPCMDDAELRRGEPALHRRYGEDVAVLTGVALLNLAYGLIAGAEELPPRARARMAATLSAAVGPLGLIGGQDRDLQGVAIMTAEAVTQLHSQKTGALFVAAVEIGATAAGANARTLGCLRRFGQELGLAFQAFDDLADADELGRGRPVASLAAVLDDRGLRSTASGRLASAKQALASGGPPLAQMCDYVDVLIGGFSA